MLNIGAKDHEQTDVSRLSDAELIQRLADQAKELGIEIDLNYSFAQSPSQRRNFCSHNVPTAAIACGSSLNELIRRSALSACGVTSL